MKKSLRLFLVALLCFAPLWYAAPTWAEKAEWPDFDVENEDGIVLLYCWLDGEDGDYVEVWGADDDCEELNIPSAVFWDGYYNVNDPDNEGKWYTVVGIGEEAFSWNNEIVSISIPNTVTYIAESAFHECESLKSLILPESVTELGDYAFRQCLSLSMVSFDKGLKTIGEGAFYLCESLAEVNLNEGLEYIGEDAFEGCAITSIYIPGTVTFLGGGAFYGCYDLETIIFGEGLTSLVDTSSDYVFDSRESIIREIFIPSTLTHVGKGELVFGEDVEERVAICYAVEPPECEKSTFEFYPKKLYVPEGSKETYLAADGWKESGEIIEMTHSFTISSASYATYYTENDYTMPEGVIGSTVTGVEDEASDGGYYLSMPWEYEAGSTVPAKTALVLKGSEETYTYTMTSPRAATLTDNLLLGSSTATETTGPNGETTGYMFYELTKGNSGKVGFYWADDEGGAFTSEANKAWLALTDDQARGAKFFGFDKGDDTTGISSVEVTTESIESGIYTLQGVRVSDMNQKGIYIVNGKKILVK